ncbi:MAG TPA: TonB family protein, partial [Candidatus Dormibacteraeota bacterium]|nr:TonB family protein [Candidatus Dormibacteraeota bacterium]
LARRIKQLHPGKLIVAGGHYASCAAQPLLEHHPELDMIVIHEGEQTLMEIVAAAANLKDDLPKITGIAYRENDQVRFTPQRRTLDDLDTLPFPERGGRIHTIAGVPTSFLMGSRGCYENCAYCCITTLHNLAPGKKFRQRSVELIADEMAELYRERGTRQFVFHDDNFLVPSVAHNQARIEGFDKAFKSRGMEDIALLIKCRPADANRDVLSRLKEMGLVRIFMGIESATEMGLLTLDRHQTVGQSIRALDICGELDVSAQFTIMTFNPDANLNTLRADLAFMRRFAGNPLNFCRAEIYAGTPLEKRMIALGRARGDYRAREYSMYDPVADLACTISLDLFYDRSWGDGSLMQKTIGLDHMIAVRKRFNGRDDLCERAHAWVRAVNLDTLDLLEEVIELSASGLGKMDAAGLRKVAALKERELRTRNQFLLQGLRLKTELDEFRLPSRTNSAGSTSRFRLGRQVAAAVLAIGVQATLPAGQAVAGPTSAPMQQAAGDQEKCCTLAGTVTDASGAVVTNAAITITNIATNHAVTLKVDEAGQYTAKDLAGGKYDVKAEANGFKTTIVKGVEVSAGKAARLDIRLEIGNWGGCCEYAAAPMKAQDDYVAKMKPFNYTVGEAEDGGTLRGIAKLVYGDRNMWVRIYEANRDVLDGYPQLSKLGYGLSLTIPSLFQPEPKLETKILPAYPPEAASQHVHGEVAMDVTLNDDGTVQEVKVIEGDPLLADAATAAVEQWKYHPRMVHGKLVNRIVVVLTFEKNGKVH